MSLQTKNLIIRLFASLLVALVIGCIWIAAKKQPQEQATPNKEHQGSTQIATPNNTKQKPTVQATVTPKATLQDIIGKATTWSPAYTSWYGKTAPDFTLIDISGKTHKLSDYRGKNTIIIFWATWCGPCQMEIPHLISLRNVMPEDKLAVLAITNENPAMVKNFASEMNINYTVLLSKGNLPSPYNMVNSIPSSFFIDSSGRIKLATSGLISLGEIKAILAAETPK